MIPDSRLVKIKTDRLLAEQMLMDLVLRPRISLIKWAAITKQTPHMKIGYIGQHLASVVTGVEGSRTGARGHDLQDQSEVKSCSRVDQLDKCQTCSAAVARLEVSCAKCGSKKIRRNNDSKWLIAVKNEKELEFLLDNVPRIILILSDYPNFDKQDWTTLQFQVFELWPRFERHKNFRDLMTGYYERVYLRHIERNPRKTPAPKNLWPYSFQFYMCNPVRVFHSIVHDAVEQPTVEVLEFVSPMTDRSTLEPAPMPLDVLNQREASQIIDKWGSHVYANRKTPGLTERQRSILKLRQTDIPISQRRAYQRGMR